MSRIFLSHSSKDNFAAVAVCDWLKAEGWEDVFLDVDPKEGIHPGERWERALYTQASDCEAVLFLVSRNWLASEWCRREHDLARRLNKCIFVVLIETIAIDDLPLFLKETRQAVSLAAGEDHLVFHPRMPVTQEEGQITFSAEGLARLKNGLTRAGLDPRFFTWPPEADTDRAPYRGLEPLDAVDAGVFFGRDGPIIEALDALRGLREAAAPRLFVILGASGAGKSSFLRAGLSPRLRRDDRNFLALPIIRPERTAISGANGFVAALAEAAVKRGLAISRAQIRESIAGGAAALRPILQKLAARTGEDKPRTLVIAIDQAEELFAAEGAVEGERLLELLRDFTSEDSPPVIALFAIRTDSYDALEHAKPLEGLGQKAFPLLPMPRGAYQTVIEAPARRLTQAGRKFEIAPGLTQALLEDIEKGGGSDALPLLSFTLEQLYRDHEAARRVSREDYEKFGGLSGAIDAALARVFAAADADPRIPRDHAQRLALLRRGLIPWLAGVDPETRTPRRRVARAAQIPEESRPLVDLLVAQRLLTRDRDKDTHEATIEPAHEALLRQWGGLKGWLEEDFGFLATLEGVKRAALDWDANARGPAWAAHGGARLEDADRLDARPDLAALLDPTDRAYLTACRARETAAREAEAAQRRMEADLEREQTEKLAERARNSRRVAWISTIGAVAALVLAAAAGWEWRIAQAQHDRAEKALALATDTANGLVFDLAQKFRNLAGVPAALVGDILTRARKLQEQLAEGGAKNQALQFSQAAALSEIAITLLDKGDTEGALDAARRSLDLMRALSAADPGNARLRDNVAVSYSQVGDVLQARGDLQGATKSYRDSLDIRAGMAKSDPGDASRQSGLAASYQRLGDAQMALGDLPGAAESFGAGVAIAKSIASSNPGNAGWQSDLSVLYVKLGDVLSAQGDLQGAMKSYRDSLDIDERLVKSAPGDAGLLRELSVSLERLGDGQKALGDLQGALKSVGENLTIRERLAKSDPGNAGWQSDLALSLAKMGDVQEARGDLAEALKFYRDSLSIRDRLAKSDPGNAGWRRDLTLSLNKIGDTQLAQGDLQGAAKSYRDGLAIADSLAKSDPGNVVWRRDLSISFIKIGDVQVAQGDLQGALESYRACLSIRDSLAKLDPRNTLWRQDLAKSYDAIGHVQEDQRDFQNALKSYRDGRDIMQGLAEADPSNTGWQLELSASNSYIGDAQVALRDFAGAMKSYRDSLAIIERLAKADPDNALWRSDLAISCEKVGDAQAAQGDFQGAMKSYRDSLEIKQRVANAYPSNANRQRDLVVSYQKIGNIQAAQGDLPGASKSIGDALAIMDKLAKSDPGNAGWQSDLAAEYGQLGNVQFAQQNLPDALKSYSAGSVIMDRLAKSNPANLGWLRTLSWDHRKVGDVQLAQGDLPGALESYLEGLSIRDRLAKAAPDNADWQRELEASDERVANVLKKLNRLPDALHYDEDDLAVSERQAQRDATNEADQRDLAIALSRVGTDLLKLERRADAAADYEKALAIRHRLAVAHPDDTSARDNLVTVVGDMGELSFESLFAREFDLSLATAEKAIDAQPRLLWLQTNRAHALMFLGRVDEARSVYLGHRGEIAHFNKAWETIIRGDFAALRKAGLTHPLMDEIEAAFGAAN